MTAVTADCFALARLGWAVVFHLMSNVNDRVTSGMTKSPMVPEPGTGWLVSGDPTRVVSTLVPV